MAIIAEQLYVLRDRRCEEIDVYSTADYRLLRRINLDDLKADSTVSRPTDIKTYLDMVSCPVKKYLYLLRSSSIQRTDLLGNIAQSDISGFDACGISVAPNCNLIVSGRRSTGRYDGKKQVYIEWDWKASKILREVELKIGNPVQYLLSHPLHVSNGHVVMYCGTGCYGTSCHGIYLVHTGQNQVDTGDRNSYGTDSGSSVGRLSSPCHMSVDSDTGCIFVADSDNRRVVLLSHSLLFLRYITDGMRDYALSLKRVCFDSATRRLYVGMYDSGGVLKVLQFCGVAR